MQKIWSVAIKMISHHSLHKKKGEGWGRRKVMKTMSRPWKWMEEIKIHVLNFWCTLFIKYWWGLYVHEKLEKKTRKKKSGICVKILWLAHHNSECKSWKTKTYFKNIEQIYDNKGIHDISYSSTENTAFVRVAKL